MACKPFQKKDAIHRFDAGMVSFFLPSVMHKYRPQATMFRIVNALIGHRPRLSPGRLRPAFTARNLFHLYRSFTTSNCTPTG